MGFGVQRVQIYPPPLKLTLPAGKSPKSIIGDTSHRLKCFCFHCHVFRVVKNNNSCTTPHFSQKNTITFSTFENQPSKQSKKSVGATIAVLFPTASRLGFPDTCELPSILLGNDPKLQAMLMKPSSPEATLAEMRGGFTRPTKHKKKTW